MDIERLEGETLEEYQIRLSLYKLIDGKDLDWEDIKDLLKSNKHRDTIRREGYGIKIADKVYSEKIYALEDKLSILKSEMKKYGIEEEKNNTKLSKLDDKILQLEKEKIKLRDQRTSLNAIKRDIARMEHLTECVKEDINNLNNTKPLISDKVDVINLDKDAILLLSDLHIGAYCENIIDKYNPNICKDKLNYYINSCINKIKQNNIQNVYFIVAGDIMSGIIHNTTRYTNRLNACEQVIFASELLSEAINKVSKYANVCVGILAGNHDRIISSKTEHMEDENFVEFIREMVKLRLNNNKAVCIVDPQDSTLLSLDIRGHKTAVVHGNLDKKKSINRLIELNGDIYDYVLMGHYHRFEVEQNNNTTIITNGSFSGEEYSKNYRLYNKPQQLFMTITNDGIEDICPINLNNYNK